MTQTKLMATALVLAIAALSDAERGHAAELCVVCTEPAAAYRCALTNAQSDRPADPGLQLYCIQELASRGHHKSCSINRTKDTAPCQGPLVTLDPPTLGSVATPVTVEPPASAAPETTTAAPPASEPPAKAPPATVEALAKETAEQSKKDLAQASESVAETTKAAGQGIKKVGETVGNAIKKSWDCLASVFSSC